MSGKTMAAPAVDQKQIGTGEFIWYMVSVFFYTNMTGMVGQYRNNFLVDVVQINQHQAALFNTLVSVVPWVLNFFIVMYIDGRAIGKRGKFRPLVMLAAVCLWGCCCFLVFGCPGA